jgi:hypothetical protein
MIEAVQSVKQTTGEPYASVCRELGVDYSSLMRWKGRQAAGEAIVRKPGPGKVGPLDLDALTAEIRQLAHRQERTHGTGALHALHQDEISRRDFQTLVADARAEYLHEKQEQARQIDWLAPSLVWSMDDAEIEACDVRRVHLHVVHDLGSRYTLCVLGNDALADGPTIARNLVRLFKQHGAPLFFKRDNGSNLNHAEVNKVLAEHGVIPLNSPAYYPPYNGGMEHKQLEIKEHLKNRFTDGPTCQPVLVLAAEICGHDLNHLRRPVLGHRTACQTLAAGRPTLRQFNRRKRKETFEKIKSLAVDITANLEQHTDMSAEVAFRYAAESWMQSNNIIRVRRNGQVLPSSYRFQ